jgi:hypothetical protein
MIALAALALVASVAFGWLMQSPGQSVANVDDAVPRERPSSPTNDNVNGSGGQGQIETEAAARRVARNPSPTSTAVRAAALSPVAALYLRGDLRAIYERYLANPQGADAETRYYAALALTDCLGKISAKPVDARQNFANRIAAGDTQAAERLRAYDRAVELCQGMPGSFADARRLMQEAANAGHAGAKLGVMTRQYQDDFARRRLDQGTDRERRSDLMRLSEEQLATVRDALASGDASALHAAGQLLAMSQDMANRMASNTLADATAMQGYRAAWQLAACERGYACEGNSMLLLNRCMFQGQCGMMSVEQQLQAHELSPNAYLAALPQRARVLDAIAHRRWDELGVAPGMGRTTPLPPATATAPTKPKRA